jgi:hypothetical protein
MEPALVVLASGTDHVATRGQAGAFSMCLHRHLCRKLSREAACRLPRALRRRAMWRQGNRAFDAMDADFREVGSP